MSRSAYPIELPPSLGSAAKKLADEDGVSLDQWVSLAVAQKIGSAEAVADFFVAAQKELIGRSFWRFSVPRQTVRPIQG